MVKAFWGITLLCCFGACAALVVGCTQSQRAAAIDAAKSVCVVIDNVPPGSQMFVFVRPLADAGAE